MFCTTVIPTIGRATLGGAVCSVLDQRFEAAEFEVVVVNDSGRSLSDAPWMRSERVRVLDTNRRERSVARNAGAAIARGKYIHFLDDDDILLPDALDAFWNLSRTTDAIWLYGAYQSCDNDGRVLREFPPEIGGDIFALLVAGESIPFQASLLLADSVFDAGGFDPQLVGVEDRDLGRRIAAVGRVASTSAMVARIRAGQEGSTTDWSKLAVRDRWAREKALCQQGAYGRLRDSTKDSYLRGRASRACLASMTWNLKRRNPMIAASRALQVAALCAPYAFLPRYWHGLRTRVARLQQLSVVQPVPGIVDEEAVYDGTDYGDSP